MLIYCYLFIIKIAIRHKMQVIYGASYFPRMFIFMVDRVRINIMNEGDMDIWVCPSLRKCKPVYEN